MAYYPYPKAHPNVVLREEFAGQYLLFHADTGAMLGINRTGAFIWKQLDGRTSMADLTRRIDAAFQVPPATARRDLADFINRLSENHLLVDNGEDTA